MKSLKNILKILAVPVGLGLATILSGCGNDNLANNRKIAVDHIEVMENYRNSLGEHILYLHYGRNAFDYQHEVVSSNGKHDILNLNTRDNGDYVMVIEFPDGSSIKIVDNNRDKRISPNDYDEATLVHDPLGTFGDRGNTVEERIYRNHIMRRRYNEARDYPYDYDQIWYNHKEDKEVIKEGRRLLKTSVDSLYQAKLKEIADGDRK